MAGNLSPLLFFFLSVFLCISCTWQDLCISYIETQPGKKGDDLNHFLKLEGEGEVAQSCPTLRPHRL